MKTLILILLLSSILIASNLIGIWKLSNEGTTSYIAFDSTRCEINQSVYKYNIESDTILLDNVPFLIFAKSNSYLIIRFLNDSSDYEFIFKKYSSSY